MPRVTKKRRKVEVSNLAMAHVRSNFNNTMITITNVKGDTICWASSGTVGFSGSKKSTPFAAIKASSKVAEDAIKYGVRTVEVYKTGIGPGAEHAIRTLQSSGLNVTAIHEKTPIPHNGVRPPKEKRG